MTISHHPSEETLLRLATGALGLGPSLVVRAHTSGCPACRRRVDQLTSVGGALLQQETPMALAPDALAKALARLDAPVPVMAAEAAPSPRRRRPDFPKGFVLPESLQDVDIKPWRTAAPGVRYCDLDLPSRKHSRTFLLRLGPGGAMPLHSHHDSEYTVVLSGSYADADGVYRAGDLAEAHADLEHKHKPVVGADEECICLIATEGRLQFHEVAARLMQPLLGF